MKCKPYWYSYMVYWYVTLPCLPQHTKKLFFVTLSIRNHVFRCIPIPPVDHFVQLPLLILDRLRDNKLLPSKLLFETQNDDVDICTVILVGDCPLCLYYNLSTNIESALVLFRLVLYFLLIVSSSFCILLSLSSIMTYCILFSPHLHHVHRPMQSVICYLSLSSLLIHLGIKYGVWFFLIHVKVQSYSSHHM